MKGPHVCLAWLRWIEIVLEDETQSALFVVTLKNVHVKINDPGGEVNVSYAEFL